MYEDELKPQLSKFDTLQSLSEFEILQAQWELEIRQSVKTLKPQKMIEILLDTLGEEYKSYLFKKLKDIYEK